MLSYFTETAMKEIFTTVHLLLCLIGPSTVCNQPRNYDMVVAGDLRHGNVRLRPSASLPRTRE